MKKLKINNKEIGLRASPLALLFYQQNFDSDLIADLAKFQEENMEKISEGDFGNFSSVKLLQMAWAMNKAAKYPKDFPTFEEWLESFDSFQVTNAKFIMGIIEEATDGFFRSGKESGGKPEQE
ncbi:MAG: hypothetical protein ACOC80_13260 [Petrotogales bacterium]